MKKLTLLIGVLLLALPVLAESDPPGPVRAIGEWEISDAAVLLWPNASLVREVAKRQPLIILSAPEGKSMDSGWWKHWLEKQGIADRNISFLPFKSDTFWVRDYQPWMILDGNGDRALVHYEYDRPRPHDDKFAYLLSSVLKLPLYELGLRYNGGNYFVDGYGGGFSSTILYKNNPDISEAEVDERLAKTLGLTHFVSLPLPSDGIQHLNTFGKLVAPDEWIFIQFAPGTPGAAEADAWAEEMGRRRSPFGTPYKIHRLPMKEPFHGYINSFVSNQTVYYPTFGDDQDAVARRVFQEAFPTFEIVPVSGEGTLWSDAVHCRTNNLFRTNTLFLFPELRQPPIAGEPIEVWLEAYPPPGNTLVTAPTLRWTVDGAAQPEVRFEKDTGRWYRAQLPPQKRGALVAFYVEATDSSGETKLAPVNAPKKRIELPIE